MWNIRKIRRALIFALVVFIGGCSTRPFLDFLDWARPGRVELAPDAKPYGGVCIPQGQLPGQSPLSGVSPIPGPSAGVVPPPAPLPGSPSSPVPPPPPGIPAPPPFPN